ncbi:vWA domain-containing protein [Microvirga puerhi]|uniref:VWA domain-containing protein n=1 Tax=Microvirga puerhi TaxID=2876078 RepID=A0ABS7VJW5_9HYPH|nr:VWA domain-containing protein [Microvirga puerhi]MBZ6075430.1 VWA domain-containing protein [Microvirga puerhi]
MRLLFAASAIILGFILSLTQGSAQEKGSPQTVLVIDASNSMWGRIDGKAKMDIARDAVSSLVDALPKGSRLGIVAYGHRRAADCNDIETVMPIGAVDKTKVQAVASKLTPRGKTPITASLKEAAGLLGAGKPGNVIIVTDGIETCKGDPCALAEELKRKNAGFVAHVVGFDVSALERPKLSCIAERTGGTFLAASNAGELGDALKTTAQAKPKNAVVTRAIPLEATDGGRPVSDATFTITQSGEAGAIAEGISGPISLPPGRYRVSAVTVLKSGQVEVEVTKDAPAKITVALSANLPKASLQPATNSVPATGTLEVKWTGPDAKDDYIVFAHPNGDALETRHYSYTRDGNPLKLRVPGEAGDYELRYVSDSTSAILARAKVTVTPVTATLDAPATGMAGAEIGVTFKGPNAPEDWVGLAKPGTDATAYVSGAWAYADHGSPMKLVLPAEPGTYEVRYVSGLDPKVLAMKKVEVTQASAALTAPAQAMAGTTIKVGFQGSGSGDTFVGIVKKGAPEAAWITGSYESPQGDQVNLRVPGAPGAYEVRFVLEANGEYKVLASAPLNVEPALATLNAPDRAKRGARIQISFTGPKGEGDYIAIERPDAPFDASDVYDTVRSDTSSVTLEAPDQAGAYEVRYVMVAPGDDGYRVIARKPLKVD